MIGVYVSLLGSPFQTVVMKTHIKLNSFVFYLLDDTHQPKDNLRNKKKIKRECIMLKKPKNNAKAITN